jgi:DNA primase
MSFIKSDDVKSGISIYDVARFLSIKVDKNKSSCPAGNDFRPSLHFYDRTNSFYCFHCGVGGSVYDYVMLYFSCDFTTAHNWLIEHFKFDGRGLGCSNSKFRLRTAKNDDLRRISGESLTENSNTDFSKIYSLFLKHCDFDPAFEYLLKRGISSPVIRASKIKYFNPVSIQKLQKLFSSSELVQSGLVRLTDSGTVTCIFQSHRLVIPYMDIDGKIITLQGRSTLDFKLENYYANCPKYVNLAGREIPMYNLPFFADCRKKSFKRLYICEGVIDVLSALSLHFPAVGVSCSHRFSEKEIALLSHFDLVSVHDRDVAGELFFQRISTFFKALPEHSQRVCRFSFSKLAEMYNVNLSDFEINDLNDFLVCLRKSEIKMKTKLNQGV